jgi:hypothetical protein
MQLLLEISDKFRSSVRNDGFWHAMQTQDASKIQLSVLISPIVGVHLNESSYYRVDGLFLSMILIKNLLS